MEATVRTFRNAFTSKLEEPVRTHLKNVYACLTMSAMAAAAGAYVDMYTELLSAGLLTIIAATGFLIALMHTSDNGKNRKMRIGFLLGFAFCSGLGMGPLLSLAVQINPNIVVTALVATVLIFTSFSIVSLTAQRGYYLYLGGTLMSFLSTLLLLSIANILFGSQLIFQAYLYIGLFLMCGFILYDTQVIVEKRRNGDRDFVTHTVDLFIDLVGVFRRLVIILSQREDQKRNKRHE